MLDFDTLVVAPCLAVFGEDQRPSYVGPAGGATTVFDAVFDDAYVAVMEGPDGPEVATIEPVLGVRLAQFPAGHPAQGGQVTVPRVAKGYRIQNVEPDGKGWALLRLQLETP